MKVIKGEVGQRGPGPSVEDEIKVQDRHSDQRTGKHRTSREEAMKNVSGLAVLPDRLDDFKIDPLGRPRNASMQKVDKGTERPNILLVMDDQHRGDYLGCFGAHWLKTPNIDGLAREGAWFYNFYCAFPSCIPSRTSLLTGFTPWHHGMLGYRSNIEQYYPLTFPQFFSKKMCYDAVTTGNKHFGPPCPTQGYEPVNQVDSRLNKNLQEDVADYEAWFNKMAPRKNLTTSGLRYNCARGGHPFPFAETLHAFHWTADSAINFIENHDKEGPWFLNLSFQQPQPYGPPKRWMKFYNKMDLPEPEVGDWAKEKYKNKLRTWAQHPEASSGIFPKREIKYARAAYAGAISFMDEQLGRVIKVLKETDQYENTFILFFSDHGEMLGDQHMYRKCRPYDPSVKIPLIMRWPAKAGEFNFQRGQQREELIELRDIFPTLADVCGLELPAKVDGESVLKILRGESGWRKKLGLEHSQSYESDNAWVAIRDNRYKYIFFTLTGEEQLFDLQKDPHELHNLMGGGKIQANYENLYRALVEELKERGENWVKDDKLQVQKSSTLTSPHHPGN